ncbi:universal stress protein [Natronolimnohabitans sp. A-GB9]|uniref:universal stress protein n=1 Tax=Natronolimnohabitans sp. A-GB9 TaxID=3069757 RepID=UPI0027B6EEF4|nr:universal stress protein [Natronolimnohabitans sp. A-GB9]MDQ2052235.1 universal stress protein [Natronolimnohabitans sp. A-GB9]
MYQVLDPIDGSDEAFDALAYSFGTFPDAAHVPIHVINPTKKRYEGPGRTEGWLTKAKREAEALHETAREMAEDHGVTIAETVTERGPPAREIVAYADRNDIDHVVLGSRGRSSIDTVVVGSVAETVTRRAPTPVTVVRNVDGDEDTPPERILVAIDGSDRSYDALALVLSKFPAGEVTAIYVSETSWRTGDGEESSEDETSERDADAILDEARERADEYGATIRTDVEHGDPSQTIAEYVTEREFDHLVVGRSGRSGWPRILLGSVAESLVHRAPVPVTVGNG